MTSHASPCPPRTVTRGGHAQLPCTLSDETTSETDTDCEDSGRELHRGADQPADNILAGEAAKVLASMSQRTIGLPSLGFRLSQPLLLAPHQVGQTC